MSQVECEFSDPIHASAVTVSPDGCFVASASGVKLMLRDFNTLKVAHLYPCIDKIERFEFSPDSEYILCAMYARNAIQVFSVNDPDWKCRIDEGVAGLVYATWCPNSRAILSESDFGIQLSVWSLTDSESYVIANPKQNTYRPASTTAPTTPLTAPTFCQQQLYHFSDCGQFLAVIHRIDLHDHCAVYAVETWTEINRFSCKTNDVICVQWTPGGSHIVTTDSPLTYAITVYRPSGEVHASFEAYEHALGVRNICWPSAYGKSSLPMVSVGSFDGKVRLLSARSWLVAFVLPLCHPTQMDTTLTDIHTSSLQQVVADGTLSDSSTITSAWGNIWVETIGGEEEEVPSSASALPASAMGARATSAKGLNKFGGSFSALAAHSMKSSRCLNRAPSVFVQKNSLKILPRVQPDPRSTKMPPQMGVHWMGFCPVSNDYLACREESQLRCLWIWSMAEVKLASLIVLQDNIVSAAWRPRSPSAPDSPAVAIPLLAFCTGTSRIYFWTPNQTSQLSCVDVPLPASTPSSSSSAGSGSSATTAPVSVASILISSISWTPNGKTLILSSRESFVTCDITVISEVEGITVMADEPTLEVEAIGVFDAAPETVFHGVDGL